MDLCAEGYEHFVGIVVERQRSKHGKFASGEADLEFRDIASELILQLRELW